MSINSQHFRNLAEQIDNAADCDVLDMIIRDHMRQTRALIEAKILTTIEIIRKFLPVMKPPGANPKKIVKWIKKFIAGTIAPQLAALIELGLEIMELSVAVAELAAAINRARDRLANCRKDQLVWSMTNELEVMQRDLDSQLVNAMLGVQQVQGDLEAQLGITLINRVDTSSPEAYARTAGAALDTLGPQIKDFAEQIDKELDEPDEDSGAFNGEIGVGAGNMVIEDGIIIRIEEVI